MQFGADAQVRAAGHLKGSHHPKLLNSSTLARMMPSWQHSKSLRLPFPPPQLRALKCADDTFPDPIRASIVKGHLSYELGTP